MKGKLYTEVGLEYKTELAKENAIRRQVNMFNCYFLRRHIGTENRYIVIGKESGKVLLGGDHMVELDDVAAWVMRKRLEVQT